MLSIIINIIRYVYKRKWIAIVYIIKVGSEYQQRMHFRKSDTTCNTGADAACVAAQWQVTVCKRRLLQHIIRL